MVKYVLPESVVVISGTVDQVIDTRLPDSPRTYVGAPQATVVQSVRGDRSHGERVLEPPRKGDTDWTIQLTADQRLASVGYSSVGVGSKVVGAGAKLLAVVAGAALRLGTGLAGLDTREGEDTDKEEPDVSGIPPTEDEARAAWEAVNQDAVEHRRKTRTWRSRPPRSSWSCAPRCSRTTTERRAPRAASARSRRCWPRRSPRRRRWTGCTGPGPARTSSDSPASCPSAWPSTSSPARRPVVGQPAARSGPRHDTSAQGAVAADLDELGVRVEIGAAPPETSWRPNTAGASAADTGPQKVSWRIPRAARLWIWTRGADPDTAVLEKATDVWVTDRFSHSASLSLEGRFWASRSSRSPSTTSASPASSCRVTRARSVPSPTPWRPFRTR